MPSDYNYRKNSSTKNTENHQSGQYSSTRTRNTRSLRGKSYRRPKRRLRGSTIEGAQNKLKQFKQASILAIAVTGILLLVLSPREAGYSQEVGDSVLENEIASTDPEEHLSSDDTISDTMPLQEEKREEISEAAKNEALNTLSNLWEGFYSNLPKILVAIVTLLLAWLLVKLTRWILSKIVGSWSDGDAIITLSGIVIWMLAIGVAVSVMAGDIMALVGSLGLVGLALSWSLQTPIESFTAWLQNSFQRYYRVGDRISVGEVFGDVYKIDFLTTTVWEIGAPYKPGFVQAEQPTGRLVTFPNSEILSGTVVNLTKDFPYVWDELAVAVANESDLHLSMQVVEKVASDVLQNYMIEPVKEYAAILHEAKLEYSIKDKPEIFVSAQESWTDITVRYLIGARERRKWKSELNLKLAEALAKPEYKDKIIPVYPRQQIQIINSQGLPIDPGQ